MDNVILHWLKSCQLDPLECVDRIAGCNNIQIVNGFWVVENSTLSIPHSMITGNFASVALRVKICERLLAAVHPPMRAYTYIVGNKCANSVMTMIYAHVAPMTSMPWLFAHAARAGSRQLQQRLGATAAAICGGNYGNPKTVFSLIMSVTFAHWTLCVGSMLHARVQQAADMAQIATKAITLAAATLTFNPDHHFAILPEDKLFVVVLIAFWIPFTEEDIMLVNEVDCPGLRQLLKIVQTNRNRLTDTPTITEL
jgi:hypothetical protein